MKVVFMGTPDFAVPTLQKIWDAGHEILLVVTQPDRAQGRGKNVKFSPVKQWAVEKNIAVFQPERIKRPEAVAELKKYPADIFVVAAFGQILSEEILKMPLYGCINVHASLLPKYRGASPIQWAVINGDPYSGVTIQQMGIGIDDGDILMQKKVPLEAKETGGSLFEKLSIVGAELCVETMLKIEEKTISPEKQDESQATHVGMIQKQMGNIDFMKSAREIEQKMRGLTPWPGTYTTYGKKTLKIFAADVMNQKEVEQIAEKNGSEKMLDDMKNAGAGAICYADKKNVIVKTGDGFLSIKEVQLENKKRMPVEEFLRGHELHVGDFFGE